MELVLRLPDTHPLRQVEVDCAKRVGVSAARWRRWVLQIVRLLASQVRRGERTRDREKER